MVAIRPGTFARPGVVRQGWWWTGAFAPAYAALERYAGFVEALPLVCSAEAHGHAPDGGSDA